jgi:hypothetical protein
MAKFQVLIKEFNVKSLITGDAEIEIKLRGRLDKKNLKEMIDLYSAEEEVNVHISKS